MFFVGIHLISNALQREHCAKYLELDVSEFFIRTDRNAFRFHVL